MDVSKLRDHYRKNGFVVVDSGLDDSLLDAAIKDLDGFFGKDRKIPEHVPFSDYGRIQDAWHISQNVLNIALSETISQTLLALYKKPAVAFQTLNFERGTKQPVHSDTIHFNSEPFGSMCGVWTALEDIGEDQGPLIYYPGSHKLPEMNYPDFGLPASSCSYKHYLNQLEKLIVEHDFQPEYGTIKKGQSLIWSANLLHGGSQVKDKSLTRYSQVTHFYIGKPKAWRPSESASNRFYFKPETVKDVSELPYKYPLIEPPTPTSNALANRIYQAVWRRLVLPKMNPRRKH
ncbi:hypothetical protein NBRC116583_14900 [Arenicella sp. 4NH20-0111]|uniref:phytanoyl-CoA dioxygenase family protein n=1 Tax=Arenicella sp. 4NH20-0111 TaxID=3127648 RepID=UPI0031078E4D